MSGSNRQRRRRQLSSHEPGTSFGARDDEYGQMGDIINSNPLSTLDIVFRVVTVVTLVLVSVGLVFGIVAHITSRSNSDAIDTNLTNINILIVNVATNALDILTNAAGIFNNTASIATNAAAILVNMANITSNAADITTNTDDVADLMAIQGNKLTLASSVEPCICDGPLETSCGGIYPQKLIEWHDLDTGLAHVCDLVSKKWVSNAIDFYWAGHASGTVLCQAGENLGNSEGCSAEWMTDHIASGNDATGMYAPYPLEITHVSWSDTGASNTACLAGQTFDLDLWLFNTEWHQGSPLTANGFVQRTSFEFYATLISGMDETVHSIRVPVSVSIPPDTYWAVAVRNVDCDQDAIRGWTAQLWQRSAGLDYSTPHP